MLTRTQRAAASADVNKENSTAAAPPAAAPTKKLLVGKLLTKQAATIPAQAPSALSAIQLRTKLLVQNKDAGASSFCAQDSTPAPQSSPMLLRVTPPTTQTPGPLSAASSSDALTTPASSRGLRSILGVLKSNQTTAESDAPGSVAPTPLKPPSASNNLATPAPPTRAAPPVPGTIISTPAPAPRNDRTPMATPSCAVPSTPSASSSATIDMPTSFTVRSKIYTVISQLGVGGSATVWKVQAPCGAFRALKVMIIPTAATADTSKHVADYESEINILELLSKHAAGAVVPMLDHEVIEEAAAKRVHIVMELAGPTLHEYLVSHFPSRRPATPLSSVVVRSLFLSLASAVSRVHESGVAHLDLKPANFVSCANNSRLNLAPSFALVDFGTAKKMSGAPLVRPPGQDTQGTLAYMAGEFFEEGGGGPGMPADIWALGVLLYQLIYARRTPLSHVRKSDPKDEKADVQRQILSILFWSSEDGGVNTPQPTSASTSAADLPSASSPFRLPFPPSPLACADATDLIRLCLQRQPTARPTIQEVLQHRFLTLASAPSPSTVQLPPSEYVVSASQIHSLIGQLANSVLSGDKLRAIEDAFLRSLRTAV